MTIRRLVIPAAAGVLCLLLAGCTIPRGAGLQSEVLAAQTTPQAAGEETPSDFAVFSVTRDTSAIIADWPTLGPPSRDWIRRQEQPASSLIAPGDTVAVTVWDTDPNSLLGGRFARLEPIVVSAGGEVFLPFVGDIQVSGMAPGTARARVEERYAQSMPSAQVQLSVTPGRANTANLVAGVATPGVYPLPDRDFTVLGLLSLGGGVAPGLNNPQISLFRGTAVYATSLDRLYDDPGLDTTLQGGDRVIVEAEERYFLSLGAAGTESVHVFPQDRVTALDAMSLIGGISDERANPKGILILREYPQAAVRAAGAGDLSGPPQARMVFTIDLTTADGLFSAGNFRIMPKDLVYATESPVTTARTVLGLLGSILSFTNRL